jgi:hypothetical protein
MTVQHVHVADGIRPAARRAVMPGDERPTNRRSDALAGTNLTTAI